jgi:hypothetical protein
MVCKVTNRDRRSNEEDEVLAFEVVLGGRADFVRLGSDLGDLGDLGRALWQGRFASMLRTVYHHLGDSWKWAREGTSSAASLFYNSISGLSKLLFAFRFPQEFLFTSRPGETMLAIHLCLTFALLPICCFVPGFFFVRRFHWSPLEKLCGSIALSLILLYLVTFIIYNFASEIQTALFVAFSLLCLTLGLFAWTDIRRLAATFRVRHVLAGFGFLSVWTFLLLAMIRNYSGARWSGDWIEHFHRTLFFLHHYPLGTPLYGGYMLPARPPMMNILGAFFLGQTADRYEIYQVVFACLNLLVFLPTCLMMPALLPTRKRWRTLPLVVLFALSPVVMQSITYAWTKALTAFFVIVAVSFYLRGLRKGDFLRIVAAFVAIAAGMLVHYSAGPYLVFLSLHYVIFGLWRPRPRKVLELATVVILPFLLLVIWFGWSIAIYGNRGTFASNTSITSSQQFEGHNLEKIGGNLFDSIVPVQLRNAQALKEFDQPNLAGEIRDYVFLFYQTNLIFAMGVVGGPVVLWLLWNAFRRWPRLCIERWFWTLLIPFVIITGIAVVGERDTFGVAHLTLLPTEILGLGLLAASFPLQRIVMVMLLAGCMVDFSLGIFLHSRVESLENTEGRHVFGALGSDLQMEQASPDALSFLAWYNWKTKHQYALTDDWSKRLDAAPPENKQAHEFAVQLRAERDANDSTFFGWYPRHGGSIELLGDHLAGPPFAIGAMWFALDAPSALLLVALSGLMYFCWKSRLQYGFIEVPSGYRIKDRTIPQAKRCAERVAKRRNQQKVRAG